MLALNLPAIENKKYTAYDRLDRDREIPTKKESMRTLGFSLDYLAI